MSQITPLDGNKGPFRLGSPRELSCCYTQVRHCILQGLHCRPVRLHSAAPLWILHGPGSIAVPPSNPVERPFVITQGLGKVPSLTLECCIYSTDSTLCCHKSCTGTFYWPYFFLSSPFLSLWARRDTVLGRVCLSSCRRHRRSSSLPQARNLNQETPSSMWQEPLTSFVSFSSVFSAIKMPALRTPCVECVLSQLEAWFLPLDCYLFRHWSCGLPRGSAQACSEAIHYSWVALWSGESHLHDLATLPDL